MNSSLVVDIANLTGIYNALSQGNKTSSVRDELIKKVQSVFGKCSGLDVDQVENNDIVNVMGNIYDKLTISERNQLKQELNVSMLVTKLQLKKMGSESSFSDKINYLDLLNNIVANRDHLGLDSEKISGIVKNAIIYCIKNNCNPHNLFNEAVFEKCKLILKSIKPEVRALVYQRVSDEQAFANSIRFMGDKDLNDAYKNTNLKYNNLDNPLWVNADKKYEELVDLKNRLDLALAKDYDIKENYAKLLGEVHETDLAELLIGDKLNKLVCYAAASVVDIIRPSNFHVGFNSWVTHKCGKFIHRLEGPVRELVQNDVKSGQDLANRLYDLSVSDQAGKESYLQTPYNSYSNYRSVKSNTAKETHAARVAKKEKIGQSSKGGYTTF